MLYPIWLYFCSSLISRFPNILLSYCLSDSEAVPVTHIITDITFAVTFHMRWISVMRSFYILKSSQLPSWSHFCLQELQHACSFLIITDYDGQFIARNSSVASHCWFHNMVTLPSWLVSTDFGTGSYRCLFSDFTPFPCVCQSAAEHTHYQLSLCTVLLPILGMLIWYCLFSYCWQSLHLLYVPVCNIFAARYSTNLIEATPMCVQEL